MQLIKVLVENDLDKATLLNSYFSQCFNQTVSPLTDDDISMFDSTNSFLCPEEFLCTEDEVLAMLLSLDTKKANGRDRISARILNQLLKVLLIVSHCCLTIPFLQEKYLKLNWKVSSVIPVPKGSADSTSVSNYRPILMTISILMTSGCK